MENEWVTQLKDVKDCSLLIQGNSKIPCYLITRSGVKEVLKESSSSFCWKFCCMKNDWHLESSKFLELRYRPSYTALPSYTNISFMRDYFGRISSCFSRASPKKISLLEEFGSNDILEVKIEKRKIVGVGECNVVQVYFNAGNVLRGYNTQGWISEKVETYFEHAKLNKEISRRNDSEEARINVTFAIPIEDDSVPLLWKVFIPSIPEIAMDSISIYEGVLVSKKRPSRIFLNGYQSWSFCGSVRIGDDQPKSALPNVFSEAFNLGAKYYSEEEHSPKYKSDFFMSLTSSVEDSIIDEDCGPFMILGWLSQHEQFGLVSYDSSKLKMFSDCDGILCLYNIETDWSFCQISDSINFDYYLEKIKNYHNINDFNKEKKVGWCSWYHYVSF